ncbi:hypothetical protein Tco_1409190 [Tanacetum coccineum]
MVDLIYVPGVDSHQLQMNVFPLSLADDAKDWWISEGDEKKSQLGRNLLRNSSVDSIPNHTMERMKYWTKERTGGLIHLNSYQTLTHHSNTIRKWMEGLKSNELKESKYENPSNTATDSFFKAYEVRDIEKLSQTKCKHSNTSNSINELPNKRRCKIEKFEAIQYSLGPNEEYIAIRSYEYDIWERNEDNMSKIYQDIF